MSSTLPAQIIGRYQLYKTQTTRLVSWIVTTAETISRDAKIIITGKSSVRCSELLELVQLIQFTEPPPKIPAQVLKLAVRVMEGRRFCSQWYSAQCRPEWIEENESHCRFIAVLEEVYKILKESRNRYLKSLGSTAAQVENTPAEEPEGFISGAFAGLEVEDPLEDALGASPRESARCFLLQAESTQSNPREEKELVLWCFLQDLNDIRLFIRQAWLDFKEGGLSFSAASNIANMALAIMREANYRISEEHGEISDFEDVMSFLGLKYDIVQGDIAVVSAEGGHVIEDGKDSHLLCAKAAHFFSAFKSSWNETESCTLTAADAKAIWPCHTFGQQMLLLIPEFDQMKDLRNSDFSEYIVNDEFAYGMFCMKVSKATRIWLVVACQAMMDTYDILGDRIALGVRLLCQAAHCFKASLDECLSIRKNRVGLLMEDPDPKWLKGNCNSYYCLAEALTLGESQHEGHGDAFSLQHPLDRSNDLPKVLFWKLPTLSGTALRTLRLKAHWTSVQVPNSMGLANDLFAITTMAHFYNAAKHYGLLTRAWPDMEWFIPIQSTKGEYVPDLSKSDGATCLINAFGILVSNPSHSTVIRKMIAKFFGSNTSFTKAYLEQIVTDINLEIKRYSRPVHVLQGIAGKSRAINGDKGKPVTLTGQQLLATYREVVLAEEFELNFDYLGFWNFCTKLLRDIRVLTQKGITKTLYGQSIKAHLPDASMVVALLGDAANAQRRGKQLNTTSLALAERHCLNRAIATDGDKFTKAAKDLSSKSATM